MSNLTRLAHGLFTAVVPLLLLLAACSAAPTPTPTLTPIPPPSAVPTDVDAFCPLPRNWVTYRTQPGDSLRSLAQRTSTTVNALALGNCLNNPRGLLSGQVFYLPRAPITP
ncbi:MAG: LysM domain-containing protein [Chloroflexota bacterium]